MPEITVSDHKKDKAYGLETYKTLEQTLPGDGATWHDVPDLILQLVELERISHFLWLHGCTQTN